jgi:hypothetical protein
MTLPAAASAHAALISALHAQPFPPGARLRVMRPAQGADQSSHHLSRGLAAHWSHP